MTTTPVTNSRVAQLLEACVDRDGFANHVLWCSELVALLEEVQRARVVAHKTVDNAVD